ncbi:Hypothetical predicted protein [Marmota monax]|uniref:Uncharacterized protein n=1 Tax=Marmota monax TaxID=9995 RepID=A0A5E4B3E0_MARMO|nr:hypothetical protein GHT09_011150 [Marmota monax]VTJ63561.1 Hypothetical predicted protein [Marmota monax]
MFARQSSPDEGARAAAKQRYQSPPREEEEPELQPRPPLDPPPFFSISSLGLPRRGEEERDSGRASLDLASAEGAGDAGVVAGVADPESP